jgi:hypothetical protein
MSVPQILLGVLTTIITIWLNYKIKTMDKEELEKFFKNIVWNAFYTATIGYQLYNFVTELFSHEGVTKTALVSGLILASNLICVWIQGCPVN